LVDSDYNQRAAQCAQAVEHLRTMYPEVRSLRDVTLDMIAAAELPEILLQRAAFVIQENERVHHMVRALGLHDADAAGQFLQASHAGLRDLYEVSCDELDHLAAFANTYPGVWGARMMGGGFGGCVICLLEEDILDSFSKDVSLAYHQRFGFDPDIILFELGNGVSRVQLPS